MRQQQIVHGALDAVSLGLVLRREIGRQRSQRRAVAAGRGDELRGRENLVHLPTAYHCFLNRCRRPFTLALSDDPEHLANLSGSPVP